MALANLTINCTANVSNAVNALTDIRAVANTSMLSSTGSVSDFQKSFARDAAAVQAQSKAMGVEMGKSSVEMSKAAQVSANSISDIETSASATVAGVKELAKGFDEAGTKIKQAMGPEAAAQIESTTDRVEEFIGTRVAIAAVGLALGAVAGTIAGVGYAAYKASGFLAGLITGESYKSANIDALIATNDKVVDLQKSLHIAAQDANAMNDALSRLGINKSDVTTVAGNADSVLRGGKTSELDRLGVSYKGLDNAQVIENAKKKLDEYTEGWDRNSAAVAMGLGTYEQMTNYLKVNQTELQKSKDRLDDYALGIGPETQAAVGRYQSAMLIFNNETRLMGEGFKRVVADTTMPILTNLAKYLQEGWPSAVNFFRGVTASFASILLGLDSAAYLAIKGTIASLTAFVDVTVGIVKAIGMLATGDVKGAQASLATGWENAGKTMKAAGADMVKHAQETVSALKLAWAVDDRSNPLGAKPAAGKTFVAAAAVETAKEVIAGLTDAQKAAQQQIKEWLRTVWDTAATELAAEDFSANVMKKLGIMTPRNTGFTKNPTFGLGTGRLKSAEEIEAERKRAEAAKWLVDEGNALNSPDAQQALIIQKQYDERKQIADQYRKDELISQQQHDALLLQYAKSKSTAMTKIEIDSWQAIGGIMSGQLGQMAGMMNKANADQFAAYKAMMIAQATIATAMAVVGIMAAESKLGMFAIPLAFTAGAIGAAQIALIAGQSMPARAAGGPVSGGQSYLVGEKGPEIFTPGASGQITSNDKLNKLGNGGSVNVTPVFQISTGVAETARAEIMRVAPYLITQSVNAVKQAMRDGQFQGVPA